MIDEVITGRICDSLIHLQTETINTADSIIKIMFKANQNLSQQVQLLKHQSSLLNNAIDLQKKYRKIERNKGRKEGAVFVGIICILIAML